MHLNYLFISFCKFYEIKSIQGFNLNFYNKPKFSKKTKNCFTKLHISCYNNTHTILFFIMTPEAERFNGWAAMLGFVAAVGAYVTTGQIIPGWF